LVNSIYYGYFESPLPISMASRVHVVPDIMSHVALQRISWREVAILCMMALTVYFYAKARRWRSWEIDDGAISGTRKVSFACSALAVLLLVKGFAFNTRYPPWEYEPAYAVKSLKRNGFIAYYGCQLLSGFEAERRLPTFPGKIIATGSGGPPAASMHDGWNVVFIQVESLESRVLDVKVGDEYLLPNLQRLKRSSVYCENFFAHHRAGGSQDSELSALFSLIPSNQSPGYHGLRLSECESLCNVLKKEGYYQAGYHSNHGNFFDRKWVYKRTGFDRFVDSDGFQGDAQGWYAKDLPFFEQSWSMIEALPEPFFAYLITMQSHGPFNNYTEHAAALDLTGHPDANQAYLRSMYEVDQAIGRFFELLKNSPQGKRTMVFVYGDHWANEKYQAPDYPYPELRPVEHVPLFVYAPGLEPRNVKRVCSQIDLAPTACELLGISEGKGWLGSSVFQGKSGKVILNYPMPLVIENSDKTINVRNAESSEMIFVDYCEAMQGN
jgi:phosphoglycerol transferase MdoB-like AlkP superfamily enzyme